jgi:hypothetical protein
MPDYPDWVLKHKKKGTYINCVKGKYYLYAAHSERVPGTRIVKRVSDGYLGRITEQDGFIPSKDKISSDILVYEYGLSVAVMQLCRNIHSGFKSTSPKNSDLIFVSSILNVISSSYASSVFSKSYLSVLFPSLDMNKKATGGVLINISRGTAMINDYIDNIMGEERTSVFYVLSGLYKIKLNDKWYLSKENDDILSIRKKYKLKWSD